MMESFSSHLRTKIAKMVKMRWIWLSKIWIVMAVNVERQGALMCHQCKEIFDHMGNIVDDPNQNENCYDLQDDRYLADCPAGTHCSTSLRSDWLIQGYQILVFERSCSDDQITPQDEPCEYRSGGTSIYKDCETHCDTNGCNDDNEVELLFSKLDGNGDPEPLKCFAYRSDEDVENENYDDSDMTLMTCPRFANQGCFKAEYTPGDSNLPGFIAGYHKGCSMFPLGTLNKDCTSTPAIGRTCREHCTNDSCNSGYFSDPNKRLQCHVCHEAMDHTGRQRPDWFLESDEGCYDLNDNQYLQDCAEVVNHCMTSIKVDWYIGGEQMMQFKRSCGLPDTSTTDLSCNEGYNPPIAFKDCEVGCALDGCNAGNDIQNEFIKYDGSSPREVSCFEYSSYYDYSNNENFHQNDQLDSIDQNIIDCPAFANSGCFIGNMTRNEGEDQVHGNNSFNKGCSMLDLNDMGVDCAQSGGYTSCKYHCSNNECNMGPMPEASRSREIMLSLLYILFLVL